MIKKAMILAAGKGERLKPITETTPKPLLQVGQHKLIEHHLYALRDAGVTDVVINLAHLGEQIMQCLGNGSRFELNIQYSIEGEALETAGGIINAIPLLGFEPFIVVNADIWTDYDFAKLQFKNTLMHMVMVLNPEHHPQGDFALEKGTVKLDGGTKNTFSGIAVFHPKFFDDVEDGFLKLRPLIERAIKLNSVSGELYMGKWIDVGTVERLQLAKQLAGAS